MARRGTKKKDLTPEEKLAQALVPEAEWPYQVPGNWCWVRWGKAGEFIAGNGFKNAYQGFTCYEIPFYKVGSLKYSDSLGYIYDESNTINEGMRLELKATLIPSESILFAKIGEAIRLNRRCINAKDCCIDNNLMAFMPKWSMRYGFFWSCGVDLYDYTNATTVPAIRKSDLEMIPFPLPPLPEQHRIVARIESLFAKLDEAKEKAQAVVDGFEERKAAILHQAFSGELTKEWRKEKGIKKNTWKKLRLDECATVVSGYAFKSSDFNSKNGAPCIKITNVGVGEYVASSYEYLPEAYLSDYSKFIVEEGDILISLTRSYISAGLKVCINACPQKALLNQRVALIRNCNRLYIYYFLRSDLALTYVKEYSKTTNQPNLSIKDLCGMLIPNTTEAEAAETVRILDSLLDKQQQARDAAAAVLDQIDTMKKAILARAFRGELGTNDAGEESAVELVKKVLE